MVVFINKVDDGLFDCATDDGSERIHFRHLASHTKLCILVWHVHPPLWTMGPFSKRLFPCDHYDDPLSLQTMLLEMLETLAMSALIPLTLMLSRKQDILILSEA